MVDSEYNIPSQWKHSIIVYIPKKGSSLNLDNQRGIDKSCAISNVRNKNLLYRIKSVTESKLLGLQSGLCPGRSTTKQIMTLRFLLDYARTQKRFLTFFSLTIAKLSIQWTEEQYRSSSGTTVFLTRLSRMRCS